MRKNTSVFPTIAIALVVSCHRPPSPRPATAPEPSVDFETARLPLVARLEREAKARPTGTPRYEDVLAALGRGGLTLTNSRQVLASKVGAAYCASAVTPKGAIVGVCEFAAEDAAQRGLQYSHQTFDRLIPGLRLLVNHKTLLSLTRGDDSEAKTAAAIFAAL